MPQGARNQRENRFSLLSSDAPASKKNKSNKSTPYNFFPDLPNIVPNNPKYIVITSTTENKKLSDFSCFGVYRSLQLISKEIISISELRDGNLLLLVKDEKTAKKFLASPSLLGVCSIKCTLHQQLNTSRGTIYAPYLNNVPVDEIVKELKDQGVVDAFKFNRYLDGKAQPSGVLLLSFNSYNLPSKIDISWHSVKVREYVPNPMRCKNCQLLGHTAKWCKNTPACVNCNLPPHSPEACTRSFCANCAEQHSASSNLCPKFIQQKEILTIKTKNKCSMTQARQIYRAQVPQSTTQNTASFASVVATTTTTTNTNSKTSSHNNSTQVPPTTQNKTFNSNSIEPISKKLSNNSKNTQSMPPPSLPITQKLSHEITVTREDKSVASSTSHSLFSSSLSHSFSPPLTRKKAKSNIVRSSSNSSLTSNNSCDLSKEEAFSLNSSNFDINLSSSSQQLAGNPNISVDGVET